MAPKITQQVKAHYTPDDIKALIVADMRAHGFADIVSADINDGEFSRLDRPEGYVPGPFDGYWIAKDIAVKPKLQTREAPTGGGGFAP